MKKRFIKKQMDIAAQIYELLQKNNWTQGELAERSGVSEQQVSTILSGHANPTLKTLVKIEDALDADVMVAPKFYKKALYREGFRIIRQSITSQFDFDFQDILSNRMEIRSKEKTFSSFTVKGGGKKDFFKQGKNLSKKDYPQAA